MQRKTQKYRRLGFRTRVLLFAAGVLLLPSSCQDSSPGNRAFDLLSDVRSEASQPISPALERLLAAYQRYFEAEMKQTGTPGAAIVIAKDGEILLRQGYGVRKFGTPDSVDIHTVFRIGSLSKGFAAVLAGIFRERGWLSWEDPVQQYYPIFSLKDPQQASRIEIWHLLSHTTGMPYHAFDNLSELGYDLETIVKEHFPKASLYCREGESYRYQNVAFSVIQPVLSAISGKRFPELLDEFIFKPGGLESASCGLEPMLSGGNVAMPHRRGGQGFAPDKISSNYYDLVAAGGLNASISDMGEWLRVLMGAKPGVICEETLSEIFYPVIGTGTERRIFSDWLRRDQAHYGLGWRVLHPGNDTLIYHAGYVNNYHSEIAFSQRDKVGICVLFNANSPMKRACIRKFFELWEECRVELEASGAEL